jgi:putative zinc finger protein
MSVLTCAEVRELAPELALGVLGGAERAETIAHVNECARCQAYVVELTEAADALPQLAPEIEPPAGFEQRVLTAIRAGRRRNQRRWIASIAAVAAAVAILSINAVRVIESGQSTTSPTADRATAAPVSVTMDGTATGAPAGWAYVTGKHVVAVMVSYGAPSGQYQVQATPSGGAPETLGTMTVTDSRGSWTGKSATPITTGSTIALVDATGNQMCHGTVPA